MKNSFKLLLGLMLLAGASYAVQTCQNTDFFCYESGPSQNLLTPARLDANGNLTLLGNTTVSGNSTLTGNSTSAGATVYTPKQVTVSTNSIISPVGVTYIQLNSTNSIVSLGSPTGSCVIPIIATTTATNGQLLVLDSTSTLSYVTLITTGTTCGLSTTTAPPISLQVKPIDFIFDGPQGLWKQIQQ